MLNLRMLDSADPRIADLANTITGDWPKIIAVWEDFRQRNGYYLRADLEADRDEFLRQALWAALGKQQLRALLNRFHEQGLTSQDVAPAAAALLGAAFNLQSFVNGRWQSQDALVGGRRLLEACDHVCRIAIGGRHRGTGILLRPTIVATAAHVVAPLLGANNRPTHDSLRQLSVAFIDADALMADEGAPQPAPIVAQLHQDWLGYFSPPAEGEGGTSYPIESIDGIASEVGPWDLALIRLATPPRSGLNGYRLLEEQPLEPRFGLHVLHHPADALGAPMGLIWSIGEIRQRLGHPRALRWLHDANTDSGSSGAPCFDTNWRVVGLHQAGQAAVSAMGQNNRAVPVYPWAGRIDRLAEEVDGTPYVNRIAGTDGRPRVVFGRREFQARAWRAMAGPLPEAQRIFLILGDAGSGKTFTGAILAELARQAGCRHALLDARNAQGDTPLAFARRMVGALGGALPDLSGGTGLTTQLRDMQNDVLPVLAQELEAIAGDRPLWLVLDGLEVCDTAASGPGELIEGVLAALKDMPHLNLVLLGWKGSPRSEFAEVLAPAPAVEDIVTHLLQHLAPPGFVARPEVVEVLRAMVSARLDEQTHANAFARAAAAAASIEAAVAHMLGVLAPATAPLGAPRA